MKLLTKTNCSCFPGHKLGRKTGPPTANGEAGMWTNTRITACHPAAVTDFTVLAGNIVFPNFKEEINV